MAEIHDRSNAQERRLARSVNGQASARSGAGWLRKGDVRSGRFLYEAKTTGKKSYTISADTLKTIRQHAYVQDRIPVLTFEMDGREYAVVSLQVWIEETGGG